MTSNSSPPDPARTPSRERAEGLRRAAFAGEPSRTAPSSLGEPAAGLGTFRTPLLAREPGTHDYELARALLGRQFPHGHTARALLDMYRDHTLDLSVETVIAGIGTSTRLIITTAFTTPATGFANRPESVPLTSPDR